MSFSLHFTPEFFLAEGEPYDRSDLALNSSGEPVSVYSALSMVHQQFVDGTGGAFWEALAHNVFGCEPQHLQPEAVLERIEQTNTCGTLTSPVDVWIDAEGFYSVLVYDDAPSDDDECDGCEFAAGRCPRCGDGT